MLATQSFSFKLFDCFISTVGQIIVRGAIPVLAVIFLCPCFRNVLASFATADQNPTRPPLVMYSDPRQNQYLAVEKVQVDEPNVAISQELLMLPLCECIQGTNSAEVAESAVETLHVILESCGHDLGDEAWTTVIEAVGSLPSDERSSPDWANSCLVGFRCLKLIVDDFAALTDPSAEARAALLDCCSSFGSSQHDVNTSLTAIGLLWTISDQDTGTAAIDVSNKRCPISCYCERGFPNSLF